MKSIPMVNLKLEYEYMKDEIDSVIKRCLEHQNWILGLEVKELEDSIAEYLGVKHCIGVSSGTEALVLSLRALAIKIKGKEYFDKADEIITTPFTFTATGDAILRAGAKPVFIDIDPVTYNIDSIKIREYLTQHSKLKTQNSANVIGIIPVHLYGQSCDMDRINAIAEEYGLFVVEDVAQAFGGRWRGKRLGSIGTTGAFSFFPSKNLGGFGDGGMVSTDNDEIARLVRMLLKHGGKDKYNVDHIGYNARLDTIQAAVLLAKFKYIDEFNERRREVAAIYNEGLKGIDGVSLPAYTSLSDAYHVYNQYTIATINTKKRDEIQRHLKENKISSMVYYPVPLHRMKVFGDGRSRTGSILHNAEKASCIVLSLPIEPLQGKDVTQMVIDAIDYIASQIHKGESQGG
jgi:dTDP-4-amino-4,6-dideoxygalactose transaminase